MRPALIPEEIFESAYMAELDLLIGGRGLKMTYVRDRAGLDVGYHLTSQSGTDLSSVKVWFQVKGIRASTLSTKEYEKRDEIAIPKISLDHLRFWYASPEPIYLVVYVEAVNQFIAEDVVDVVDRQWGPAVLNPNSFKPGQETTTLKLRTDSLLDGPTLDRMLSHRTLRLDGQPWRGRPLGHRFDPHRCVLNPLDPQDFHDLSKALLEAHRFRSEEEIDPTILIDASGLDQVTVSTGVMRTTYEWPFELGTEFGRSPEATFSDEAELHHVQGKCVVVIDARESPDGSLAATAADTVDGLRSNGIHKALIMSNSDHLANPPTPFYFAMRDISLFPQGLGSTAYCVLVATLVYLDFRDRLTWKVLNYAY